MIRIIVFVCLCLLCVFVFVVCVFACLCLLCVCVCCVCLCLFVFVVCVFVSLSSFYLFGGGILLSCFLISGFLFTILHYIVTKYLPHFICNCRILYLIIAIK